MGHDQDVEAVAQLKIKSDPDSIRTAAVDRPEVDDDSVIGSSAWITHPVRPYAKVILEEPRMRVRDGKGAEL